MLERRNSGEKEHLGKRPASQDPKADRMCF